jgi:2'-5' RNA ligase
MPLAVTLHLDDETAVAVERMWRALAEQGGDDDALRLGYAPHLTFAVMPDAPANADIEKAAFDLADNWDALPLTLASFGVFPASPPAVCVAPVVTEQLLAHHANLHAALLSNPIDPHYHSGAWVPHVTLSQGASSVARVIDGASSVWCGPIRGWGDRVDLVRFRPVKILRSTAPPNTAGAVDTSQSSGTTVGVHNS